MKRAICLGILASTFALAQQPDKSTNNKRPQITADQQSNTKGDIELTRQIRRELTKTENLSTYGKNVKIVTRSGAVVLSGPMASAEEKSIIEGVAKKIAGEAHVTSKVEVMPAKK